MSSLSLKKKEKKEVKARQQTEYPQEVIQEWHEILQKRGLDIHRFQHPTVDPKKTKKTEDPIQSVLLLHKPGTVLLTPVDKELNSEEIEVKKQKITNLVTPAIVQIDRNCFKKLGLKKYFLPKFITLRGHTQFFGEPFTRDNFTTSIVNHELKYRWLVEREVLEEDLTGESPTGFIATEKYQNFILKKTGEPLRELYDVSDIDYMRAQQGAMVENDTLVDFAVAMKKDPDEALKKQMVWIVLMSFVFSMVVTILMLQAFTGNLWG